MRRQESDLSLDDLMLHPVWEYALNEELIEGQNEKTLRPYADPRSAPIHAYLISRATFQLANGVKLKGFIKPLRPGQNELMGALLPYDLDPVIVTENTHVVFCYGSKRPYKHQIRRSYRILGYQAEEIFPITFSADIEVPNRVTSGILEGFLYISASVSDFLKIGGKDILLTW